LMDTRRLSENLEGVRHRIAAAAARSGRAADNVRLVAVTKRTRIEGVQQLVALGQHELGENYPQELWKKAEALDPSNVRWHLIGHLQTNKARRTLPLVCLIHAVDSLKLLGILEDLRRAGVPVPPICLQVNCSEEPAKHGWTPGGIVADAAAIAACGQVPIVGLMTMAAMSETAESARPTFATLRETRDALASATGLRLPELSMGMSNDYEVAVEEGATLVRVGSSLWEGVNG
jgi:pyridoxal phosphate enzyme (YggS family)